MRRDPFPIYDQLRSESPVFHLAPLDLWMIFDYEGVKRALNDPETFSSGASPTGEKPLDWLIFQDPPRHPKLRALISRAFTPRSIAGLEPRVRELSKLLLDPLIDRGEIDLVAQYSVPLPLMVIAEMLGIEAGDWPRFHVWSDAILGLSETVAGGEEAEKAVAAFQTTTAEMNAELESLLAERRRTPRDDLLTRLVEAEVDGERLSQADILAFFQLLLLAGHETTTNLINNAVLCLTENPEQRAKLLARPELLPGAIEETLRHRSPVQAVFRQTKCDVWAIPAGKLVLAIIGSANRDPKHFDDPARFDITREPNTHVAFGHGIHFCLGAALSRLEAKVAIPDLFGRLRNLEPAAKTPWEPRRAFHVHGPEKLLIRFDR